MPLGGFRQTRGAWN